jgi:uncharacterized protein YjbI with pentapeptide repeats
MAKENITTPKLESFDPADGNPSALWKLGIDKKTFGKAMSDLYESRPDMMDQYRWNDLGGVSQDILDHWIRGVSIPTDYALEIMSATHSKRIMGLAQEDIKSNYSSGESPVEKTQEPKTLDEVKNFDDIEDFDSLSADQSPLSQSNVEPPAGPSYSRISTDTGSLIPLSIEEAESPSPSSRRTSKLWDLGFDAQLSGQVIEQIMNDNGLNQKEFASALKIRPSSVSSWVNGRNNVSDMSLENIEGRFGIDLKNFLSLGYLVLINGGEWNEWRNDHPDLQLYILHLSQAKKDLTGLNFANVTINHGNIKEMDFSESTFLNSTILNSTFIECKCTNTNFQGTHFQEIDFEKCDLSNSIFSKIQSSPLNIESSDLNNTDFRGASFVAMYFNDNTNFFTADFRGVIEAEDQVNASNEEVAFILEKSKLDPMFDDQQTVPQTARGRLDTVSRAALKNELNVARYAKAIAEFFRAADRDFCFAIYGPWGRGKTHLMDLVARDLESTATADSVNGNDKTEGAPPPVYEVIQFSAWQHRTPTEVWAFLYENMRKTVESASMLTKIPRVIRTGYFRYGYFPVMVVLLFLILFAFFSSEYVVANDINIQVGTVTLSLTSISLYQLAKGSNVIGLFQRFRSSILSSHQDKLGLKAMLGDDLKALLKGWIPVSYERKNNINSIDQKLAVTNDRYLPIVLMYVLLLVLGLVGVLYFGVAIDDLLSTKTAIYMVGYAGLLAGLFAWILLGGRETNRVLLVIDDLDRCELGQVLEIMENLLLILEDSDIQDRVQICMLVEETVLDKAILTKFDELISYKTIEYVETDPKFEGNKEKALDHARKSVIRDHKAKIFLAHLRLGYLLENEVESISNAYLDIEKPSSIPALKKTASPVEADQYSKRVDKAREIDEWIDKVRDEKPKPSVKPPVVDISKNPSPPTDTRGTGVTDDPKDESPDEVGMRPNIGSEHVARPVFVKYPSVETKHVGIDERHGPEETARLHVALTNIAEDLAKAHPKHEVPEWTPRYIRSFHYKYDLARLLCEHAVGGSDHKELVDLLEHHARVQCGLKSTMPIVKNENVRRIAFEVS